MAGNDLAGDSDSTASGNTSSEDWDSALSRLLEGVNLDELTVPTSGNARRNRLTFDAVHELVADQLREKVRTERMRREAIERLDRQVEETSEIVTKVLHAFTRDLLDAFNGGGIVSPVIESRDGRTRTWHVLAFRSPGKSDEREVVVTVLLAKKGVDALDRGQPALDCRVSTPRNPRLVDFTAGTDVRADLEDTVCRAYQDILGTLRLDPTPDSGVHLS